MLDIVFLGEATVPIAVFEEQNLGRRIVRDNTRGRQPATTRLTLSDRIKTSEVSISWSFLEIDESANWRRIIRRCGEPLGGIRTCCIDANIITLSIRGEANDMFFLRHRPQYVSIFDECE